MAQIRLHFQSIWFQSLDGMIAKNDNGVSWFETLNDWVLKLLKTE